MAHEIPQYFSVDFQKTSAPDAFQELSMCDPHLTVEYEIVAYNQAQQQKAKETGQPIAHIAMGAVVYKPQNQPFQTAFITISAAALDHKINRKYHGNEMPLIQMGNLAQITTIATRNVQREVSRLNSLPGCVVHASWSLAPPEVLTLYDNMPQFAEYKGQATALPSPPGGRVDSASLIGSGLESPSQLAR